MEFLETSEKLSLKELDEIEDQIGVSFPQEFRNHYRENNGGYPVKSYYLWPNGDKTRINHFFSMKYEGFTNLEQVYTDLFVIEQTLPLGFLPFAADDGGDFFCISMLPDSYNKVYFCDTHHYDAENFENYFTLISDSFNGFIENLVD